MLIPHSFPHPGLKFVDRDTLFLSPEKCAELFAIADGAQRLYRTYDGLGRMHEVHDAAMRHINRILGMRTNTHNTHTHGMHNTHTHTRPSTHDTQAPAAPSCRSCSRRSAAPSTE